MFDRPIRARRKLLSPNAIRLISVAIFMVFWEITARDMDPIFISYPSAIFDAALKIIANGELQRAFMASLVPLSVSLVLSIVLGVAIGVAMAEFSWLEYVLDPFVNALYAIPRVALVPLIILWAGLELAGKITIIVSIAIFPVIINTYSGIKDVRGSLLEIGRAYCATPRQIFFKITLPASVPYIMAGIRLCVGLAIIGLIVAEFFTAIGGLGGLIVNYANSFATAKLFVPIIVVALLGVGLTGLVQLIEQRLSRWRISEKKRAGE
jgi:NitT/TauT family transport system permease protein